MDMSLFYNQSKKMNNIFSGYKFLLDKRIYHNTNIFVPKYCFMKRP